MDRTIHDIVQREQIDEAILRHPNTRDPKDNLIRRQLLGLARGYPDDALFKGYPDGKVRWVVAGLSPDELRGLVYLGQDVWTDLSGPSRKAGDAAARLASTDLLVLRTLGAVNNARLIGEIVDSLQKGKPSTELVPLIVLAQGEGGDHVVLEGCKRLTALLLKSEMLPPELPVLAGYSPRVDEWFWYRDRSA